MSFKAINFTARNTIGSFLTSAPESSMNKAEYEVVSIACDKAVESLKAEKIRGHNLLHSLPQLASIIADVTDLMVSESSKRDLNDAKECWNAFAMIIVHSALANYYKKSEFAKGKMD